MGFNHIIESGDCVSSIAFEQGLLPQTVWKHPNNAELRKARKDPNVLLPGDELFVPDLSLRHENAATDRRHKYVRSGVPEVLRIFVEDIDGKPRANVLYALTIDGKVTKGRTGDDGLVTCPIFPNAHSGSLVVGGPDDDEYQQEFELALGGLNPINDATGVQQRLINLGFHCGEVDGIIGPHTEQAIARYQEYVGLEPTGKLDSETLSALEKDHKS